MKEMGDKMILYGVGFVFVGLLILSLIFPKLPLPPTVCGLYALTSFMLGLLKYSNLKFIFMVRYFFYLIAGFTMGFIPLILILLALLIFLKWEHQQAAWWLKLFDLIVIVAFLGISAVTYWAVFNLNRESFNLFISSYSLITMYFLSSFLSFVLINQIIHYWHYHRDYGTLIILGLKLEKQNEVPELLLRRLDKAIQIYRQQVDRKTIQPQIIVSGGVVGHIDQSEAFMMKDYLLSRGIPAEQIVMEDDALNTNQNLTLSQDLIEEYCLQEPILIVTSRFHLLRTSFLARRLAIRVYLVGSLSTLQLWPYQIVREYLAYFILTKGWHFFYLVFLIIYSLIYN